MAVGSPTMQGLAGAVHLGSRSACNRGRTALAEVYQGSLYLHEYGVIIVHGAPYDPNSVDSAVQFQHDWYRGNTWNSRMGDGFYGPPS